jgi:hypothetical protein
VVKFRIKAIAGTDVQAWQMGYSVDPTAIELLTIENGNNIGTPISFSPENFGTNRWQNGEFRALWVDDYLATVNMGSEKELFQLRIKLKQPLCSFQNVFKPKHSVLPTKFFAVDSIIGNTQLKLQVEPDTIPPTLLSIPVAVYPNPFDDNIAIEFEFAESCSAVVQIFDNSGKEIRQVKSSFERGKNTVHFEGLGSLQLGVLHYKITGDRQSASGIITRFGN